MNGMAFQGLQLCKRSVAMEKKFKEVKFQWISRESNKPVDILATQEMQSEPIFNFHTYVPLVIRDALHYD